MTKNYVIDLTQCASLAELMEKICSSFENEHAKYLDVILKLKDFQLNQSQLLSIKSLIESYSSTLKGVMAQSLITKQLAEAMGLEIFETEPQETPEMTLSNFDFSPEIEKNNEISTENEAENIEDEAEAFENRAEIVENEIDEEEIKKDVDEAITDEMTFENEEEKDNNIEEEPIEEIEEEPVEDIAQNDEAEDSNEDDNIEKKTIGVYTKAYDETDKEEIYEEVDFYATPSNEPVVVDTKQTMYINQTLRSGQTVEYDGNVLIIGDCHPGSEIRATGDITVWGVLGSIAHAGIKGNKEAKIRALKMNAIQLRIADCYSRRPDGTNIPYIVKSSSFIPEEARLVDDNIVLYKMT